MPVLHTRSTRSSGRGYEGRITPDAPVMVCASVAHRRALHRLVAYEDVAMLLQQRRACANRACVVTVATGECNRPGLQTAALLGQHPVQRRRTPGPYSG